MNLNPIGDGIADFSARAIGGFRNLQTRGLEHGDVKHQSREVINTHILAHQVKTSSTGEGLAVQRLDHQGKKSGLVSMRGNLQHAGGITLCGDMKEILRGGKLRPELFGEQRKAEVAQGVGSEGIYILGVRRITDASGNSQLISPLLIEQDRNLSAGDRGCTAGVSRVNRAEWIDDYDRGRGLGGRDVGAGKLCKVGYASAAWNSAGQTGPEGNGDDLTW